MLKSKVGFKPKAKPVARRNVTASSSQPPEPTLISESQSPTPALPAPVEVTPSPALTHEIPTTAKAPNPETSDTSHPATQATDGPLPEKQSEISNAEEARDEAQYGGPQNGAARTEPEKSHPAEKEPLRTESPSKSHDSSPQPNTSTLATENGAGVDSQRTIAPSPAPAQTVDVPSESASTPAATLSSTSSNLKPRGRPRASSRSAAPSGVPVSQPEPTSTVPTSTPAENNSPDEPEPTSNVLAATSAEDSIANEPQPSVEGGSGSSATPPAPSESSRATQPKRPRKRKADTEAGPQGESSAAPAKRPRAKRAAPLPGEEGYVPRQPRKTTTTRKRKVPAIESAEGTETTTESGGTAATAAPPAPKKQARRQREPTPEDAETREIDITQVKMADLAKDMGIGKKFSLHDKLLEQERLKRQKALEKKRQKKNGNRGESVENEGGGGGGTPAPESGGGASGSQNNATNPTEGQSPNGTNGATNNTNAIDGGGGDEPSGRTANQLAPVGETYRIVNGEIVVDESSLQVDRHARAAQEAGELEEQEENDFTNAVNSSTYLRRNLKPQQWTDEETDQFYMALGMWGTDFEMISQMFPHKNRKHVKLKYNREEKANPQRINDALIGKKTTVMDIEEYMKHTGREYETTEAIDAELQKNQEEFDERERLLREEQAEANRKKREELFGANKEGEEAENGGKKKQRGGRGRKQKQMIATW